MEICNARLLELSPVFFACLLVACGGGSGSSDPAAGQPPSAQTPPVSGFSLIGQVDAADPTHVWLHGDVALVGSQPDVSPTPVRVFDVSDPSAPQLTSTIEVDAKTTWDVQISEDGSLAVITHAESNDGLNGITLLDLADPAQPTVITRFTEELSVAFGVHQVWIDGSVLYVTMALSGEFEDVEEIAAMRIIDVSDPTAPQLITTYYGGSSSVSDAHVVNGLAFVAHWNLGLIILDVGNGMAGGSPAIPVEIGRESSTGSIAAVLYWPETGYVFLTGSTGSRGSSVDLLIVIDARDLQNPRQVATALFAGGFFIDSFALDKTRQILYVAWRDLGLIAIDVGGVLSGDLIAEGRLLGRARTLIYSQGVHFHKGLVWVTAGGLAGDGQLQVYEPTF